MGKLFSTYVLDPLMDSLHIFNEKNAFCIREVFYTYENLASRVAGIRELLRSHKENNNNIGLVTNDDPETYCSIIAIWMEGLAYVPLNPLQPVERNNEIIEQAGIRLILDSSPEAAFPDVQTLLTSGISESDGSLRTDPVSDNQLAYILFTSGSTGKPKGVPITRGNLGAFMKSFAKTGIEIDHTDRCLQSFDLTFDVSVQSFLFPLTKGACVYTIPHDQIKYSYVYGLFEDHKLTFGAMAPSMIRYLRPYFDEIYVPSMKYNILTAEAAPQDLVDEWSKCIPNSEIYDFYGPTEATIYCTYYKYTRDGANKHVNGLLSIGKPMNGIKALIIDEERKVIGSGQKGELCINGAQLMPGYWKDPEKTATAFVDIMTDDGMEKFYRTGDLCYLDEDGDILYSGRLDYQVKIQGYRIELGEIEFHAREILGGGNAIASDFRNNSGNTEIALFIEGKAYNATEIIKAFSGRLPGYMIPTKICFVKEFPLNANGKIDRTELKKFLK